MSTPPTIPEGHSISDYVEDGARVAGILFVWAVIAAFFAYGVSEIGGTGSLFETIGPQIAGLLLLAGLFNAILYVFYRTIDYWHASTRAVGDREARADGTDDRDDGPGE